MSDPTDDTQTVSTSGRKREKQTVRSGSTEDDGDTQCDATTLVMVIVSIVVIKMVDLLDCVNGNCHAELVVSIHSRWIGLVDKHQGLVEITDISKYVLEATVDCHGGTMFICS
jgi:hypothetical protein